LIYNFVPFFFFQTTLSQPGPGGPRCPGSSSGGNLTPHWADDVSRPRSGSDGHYTQAQAKPGHPHHGHHPIVHQHSAGPCSYTGPGPAYRSPVAKMFDSVFGASRHRSNSVVTADENKRKIVPQVSFFSSPVLYHGFPFLYFCA
jgi:hypothetical protein